MGAFKHGRPIKPETVKVELFVAGSVAVAPDGGRLGKGTGFSDREYSILKESGSLSPETPVITTVHDMQIVENIPKTGGIFQSMSYAHQQGSFE